MICAFFGALFAGEQVVYAQYADVQTARVDEIAGQLPEAPHALAPPCTDRAAWSPLAAALKPEIDRAASLPGKPFPAWSDDAYMDYPRR